MQSQVFVTPFFYGKIVGLRRKKFFSERPTAKTNFAVGTKNSFGKCWARVEFVKKHLERIKTTISKIEMEIELIKEFKSSMINEVVTGKIILN